MDNNEPVICKSESVRTWDRPVTIKITAPAGVTYTVSREKTPVLNENGEITGFDRGPQSISFSGEVEITTEF